jgi:hypothetical protein
MKKIAGIFSLCLAGASLVTASVAQEAPDAETDAKPVAAAADNATDAPRGCPNGCINPVEAITYATYLAPKGAVAGDFSLNVATVAVQRGMVYLNSEKDYRSRNCLTIVMPLPVARMVSGAKDLAEMQHRLQNKRIIVRGMARQVRIDFTDEGKPTGKYYFQVHVPVTRPGQVQLQG